MNGLAKTVLVAVVQYPKVICFVAQHSQLHISGSLSSEKNLSKSNVNQILDIGLHNLPLIVISAFRILLIF